MKIWTSAGGCGKFASRVWKNMVPPRRPAGAREGKTKWFWQNKTKKTLNWKIKFINLRIKKLNNKGSLIAEVKRGCNFSIPAKLAFLFAPIHCFHTHNLFARSAETNLIFRDQGFNSVPNTNLASMLKIKRWTYISQVGHTKLKHFLPAIVAF